jgi:nucleotide-binding universal stress UspA family protein
VLVAYSHVLVMCDGSAGSDVAVRSASQFAARDHAQLTVVAVAQTERLDTCIVGTDVWNDVLREAAEADLERARAVVDSPARFVVLCGDPAGALAAAASAFGCDAIVLARSRRSIGRLGERRLVAAVRRRTDCSVIQP